MNEQLKQLYHSVILQHDRQPVRYEKRENSTCTLDAANPLCGDRFRLYFDLEEGKIKDLSFHGYGCAVSKASTSVLVKHLEGRSPEQALALCRAFAAVVQPEGLPAEEAGEEFRAFAAARAFPARMKCATLSWEAMEDFLKSL